MAAGKGSDERKRLVRDLESLSESIGPVAACKAFGVPRSSFSRWMNPSPERQQPRARPARALSKEEEEEILRTLAEPRFVDLSPYEVHAILLDEGRYLGSPSTMYRLLARDKNEEVVERRNQRKHPQYEKPELVATAPNQVWSWDITRLKGPGKKFSYFYLYVIMDIYSRYVVGWMVAPRENAAHAVKLIEETCTKHGIKPDELVLHSDRGSPMTCQETAQLLASLGVIRSLSRPQTSNDNPFSESFFKTCKYNPWFPRTFPDQAAAERFSRYFIHWYNNHHRHGGLEMLTPSTVHSGRAEAVLKNREDTLKRAWEAHPERFVRGCPKPKPLPQEVYINPPPNLPVESLPVCESPSHPHPVS